MEYFKRVIEAGDMIDVIARPDATGPDGSIPMMIYWIHIHYADPPEAKPVGFREKEVGHFALRTKAGEKAERMVAIELRDGFGHPFSGRQTDSPGSFTIYWINKRNRKVDLTCPTCATKFEVKRRNRDRHYRVSHSSARPFEGENVLHGWHAFVFPDRVVHYVPNTQIIAALRAGRFRPGYETNKRTGNAVDSYAEIHPDAIAPQTPPVCGEHNRRWP